MALVTLVKHDTNAMMSFTNFSHNVYRMFKCLLEVASDSSVSHWKSNFKYWEELVQLSAGKGGITEVLTGPWGGCCARSSFLCSLKSLVFLVA